MHARPALTRCCGALQQARANRARRWIVPYDVLGVARVRQTLLSARQRSQTRLSAFLRGALDFIQRRWVFQRRCVAETGSALNAEHHFCVWRFWYVADEQNFLGNERFAKSGGERVF